MTNQRWIRKQFNIYNKKYFLGCLKARIYIKNCDTDGECKINIWEGLGTSEILGCSITLHKKLVKELRYSNDKGPKGLDCIRVVLIHEMTHLFHPYENHTRKFYKMYLWVLKKEIPTWKKHINSEIYNNKNITLLTAVRRGLV